jgi:hypothetical protein
VPKRTAKPKRLTFRKLSLKRMVLFGACFAAVAASLIVMTRATPGDLAGDVNDDNVVNIFDLSILLSNFNQTNRSWTQGDVNRDTAVNIFDLSILLSNWGKTGGGNGTTSFLETFDGSPINPEPWNNLDWNVFQTSRNRESWENPDPVNAHHAFSNCGDVALGGSHLISTWPETVFKCNGHVMTSISGEPGYAAIYLSPPAMADFTSGPSTVGFDVSTSVSSTRDWLDVLITPLGDFMQYPFRSDLDVDGSGMPANSIHIEQSFGSDKWEIEVTRNNVTTTLGELTIPYSGFGGQSRVTRTPVRIVVTRTSITLSYPTVPGSSTTVNFADLGWSQGVIQFGHHSYTPLKDCPVGECAANTWHWDNISVNPARRFYQRQATPERTGAEIHDSNPRPLSFGNPAPANSSLMFSGNCGVQVRDNASAPWRATTIIGPNDHPEHTQSYKVTVPQGSTGIEFRFVANQWYDLGYGCQLSNPIVIAQ